MRLLFCVFSFFPALSFAGGGGVDYSVITDAVDFGDMSAVVLTVAGALAGVFVIIKGVRIALSFVRGGDIETDYIQSDGPYSQISTERDGPGDEPYETGPRW